MFIILLSFYSEPSLAKEEDNKKDIYCPLCVHRDDDDPLYKKERQFYQKIHIIKSIFRNSIDEVALASAVLHRYTGVDTAYEREYEKDFSEEKYTQSWRDIFSVRSQIFSSDDSDDDSDDKSLFKFTAEEKAQIEANEKISLLTTAAIVMIDSNHFGTYSDVCFKDALAGDQLVNNDGNSGIFGDFINAFVCHVYSETTLLNPLEYISNIFNNDNFLVTAESAKNRFVNTTKVCENGFVGGLYNGVSKIKDENQKESLKKYYAQQIIDLSNYYKRLYGDGVQENGNCSVNIAGVTGDFSSWRQGDSKWGGLSLGGSSSVANAGCLVTSISMLIARSGTRIGTLPSGYNEFNPGAFVETLNHNGGFSGGGNFAWKGFEAIAPNWGVGDFVSLGVSSNKALAQAISKELSTGYGDGNYQKFLVLQIHHAKSSQHWVAVNGVENDVVTIYDPGLGASTLDEKYSNWVVDGYKVMYAKDVLFGQTGTVSNMNNACNAGTSSIGGAAQGDIVIPEPYGGKGYYTVTAIDTINWSPGSGQREMYEKWMAAGAQYDDGVAILNGRYLIACTPKFGKVGDNIDFYLEDGTKIPTIMMDEKRVTSAENSNEWGHENGANIIEFEVQSSAFYSKYNQNNPGTNGWHMEWAGKRTTSATNLGGGTVDGGIGSSSNSGGYCSNGVGINMYGSSGNKIADLAVMVTPVASPDDFIYAPYNLDGGKANPWWRPTDPSGSFPGYPQYESFARIMDETIGKYHSHDPNNPNSTGDGYNNNAYGSCAQAAGGIIRATVDPDFATGCPCAELRYLLNNPEKWQQVGQVNPGEKRSSKCQPGDLLVGADSPNSSCSSCSGHIMIYVGNELAKKKFPNTDADVFEAGYNGEFSRYPRLSNRPSDLTYKIFRPTGAGEFYYPFIVVDDVLSR